MCYNAYVFTKGGMIMIFKKQLTALATIIKDKDIRKYSGEAFWNIIKATIMGDVGALLEAGDDVKNIIFHTPTVLFWDKMQRYLYGTFKDFEEQVKLAAKFNDDNDKHEEFVKRQIHLINEIDDDKKIDYFAALTRCYLLTDLEEALFFKLAKFINICTPAELDFLRSVSYSYNSENNAMISSLYQYGLFSQKQKDNGGVVYALSDFAKALKHNSLNFEDGLQGQQRLCSYQQLAPLSIAEPATWEEIENAIGDQPLILDCGRSDK